MNEQDYNAYIVNKVKEYCDGIINKNFDNYKVDLYRKLDYGYYKDFYFYIIDNNGRSFYTRIGTNENEGITYSACNCYNNFRNHHCEHVKAAIYKHIRDMLPRPLTPYEKSLQILNKYKSNNFTNTSIKEKLKLELELSLEENNYNFKLHIGLKKTYVLNSDNKFNNFIKAYNNNEEYVFGKGFTYDPNKHYFSDQDKELLDLLSSADGYKNLILSRREVISLLKLLNNRSFTLSYYGPINKISYTLPNNIFAIDKQNDEYSLVFNNTSTIYIPDIDTYNFMAYDNTLYVLDSSDKALIKDIKDNDLDKITFKEEDLNLFKTGLLKKIKNSVYLTDNVTDIIISHKPNAKLYFDFDKNKINLDIKFDYDGNIINYFDKESNIIRDDEYENNVLNDIYSYNFIIDKNVLNITSIDDIGNFIENGLLELKDKYEVFTSQNFDNVKINKNNRVNSMFSVGQDGIMSYNFNTEGININELDKVFASIKSKKKYYKLKNGNILNLEDNKELNELNNLINDLNIDILSRDKDGNIIIPKYRAFYIDSLKKNKYDIIKTDNLFDEFINKFKKYKDLDIEFDNFDKETLRDYQKDGVRWLYTLYKCDLGGILADEMGLGKSIQTISFIKQILKEKEDAKILIVSPTALVYNWKKEFDKFGSNLKYITVADNKIKRKEIINDFDKYNIFITSYGLIRNDNDEYEDKEFELCVIDEAQAIKNYQAGLTKEIKKIKAKTKIALTGTPIENSVYELWSIFDFIMPGYLNNINSFREQYGIHEVDNESLEKLNNLNYQIKPFILRRKKIDVTKDLPDKIENNLYLELPNKQKSLYIKVLKETKDEIDELIATEGWNKASFKLLSLLTKLRQICINPNVAYENYDGEAIKIEKLIEIVHNFINDGHKILIFSTFKSIINSVKVAFDKEKISSYVITGEVKGKTRTELVDKFNNDDTNCFLITLKSGGTGLNLTGADIVIHLDIWWNPQAENQATDRAHRIGQTKNVTVIKLITKGTIEERIMELQEKKRLLSENLIEGKSDSKTISSLTEEEMEELLAFGQDEIE